MSKVWSVFCLAVLSVRSFFSLQPLNVYCLALRLGEMDRSWLSLVKSYW